MKIPCDSLIIKGEVLINESSLTGESTPVVKNGI
jgi:P-type E1-E2 ATPase